MDDIDQQDLESFEERLSGFQLELDREVGKKLSTFKVFGERRGDSCSQKLTVSRLKDIEKQYDEFQQAGDSLLHSLRQLGGKLQPSIPGGSTTDSETLCGSESSSSKAHLTLESAVQQLRLKEDQEKAVNSLPAYKYHRLEPNRARVLCLHPGSRSDQLVCSLTEGTLGDWGIERDLPQYFALSYAWGSSERHHRIRCYDVPLKEFGDLETRNYRTTRPPTCIRITSSLKNALIHLRHARLPRMLWVDSICINQEDLDERRHIVNEMARIFQQAKQVVVWLGEHDSETADALTCIENLRRTSVSVKRLLGFRMVGTLIESRHWMAFRSLLARSWFHRAWVFQEVAVAREAIVVIGDHRVRWTDLCTAIQSLEGKFMDATPDPRCERLDFTKESETFFLVKSIELIRRNLLRLSSESEPYAHAEVYNELKFERLLCCLRPMDSTDHRDKIYAILGITRNDRSILEPDYSLSIRDVYIQATKYWLEWRGRGNLDFLSYVSFTNARYNLPSWVPDWSTPCLHTPLISKEGTFNASSDIATREPGRRAHLSAYVFANAVLRVRGIGVTMIEAVAPSAKPARHKELLAGRSSYHSCSEQTYVDAYCAALLRLGHEVEEQYVAVEIKFFRNASGRSNMAWFAFLEGLFHKIISQHTRLLAFLRSRLFFLATDGRIGFVPDGTEAGDLIVIFFGCRVPFVIRPLLDGRYILIGECYVHGIMNGEAMDNWARDMRDFDIV